MQLLSVALEVDSLESVPSATNFPETTQSCRATNGN